LQRDVPITGRERLCARLYEERIGANDVRADGTPERFGYERRGGEILPGRLATNDDVIERISMFIVVSLLREGGASQ
jgi:hypothetical protein